MQRENNCDFFENALQSLVFVHCFSTKSHYFLLDSVTTEPSDEGNLSLGFIKK